MSIGHLFFGVGGWLVHVDKDDHRALIRFEMKDEKVEVAELYVPPQEAGRFGLASLIRRLPLDEMQRLLNGSSAFREYLSEVTRYPGIPLEVLASHFDTTFEENVSATWVYEAFVSTIGDAREVHVSPFVDRVPNLRHWDGTRPKKSTAARLFRPFGGLGGVRNLKFEIVDGELIAFRNPVDKETYPGSENVLPVEPLQWPRYGETDVLADAFEGAPSALPTTSVYPDDWWEWIAAIYEVLQFRGTKRPVATIADHYRVSEKRVEGWIRKCQDRGLLKPRARRPRTTTSSVSGEVGFDES